MRRVIVLAAVVAALLALNPAAGASSAEPMPTPFEGAVLAGSWSPIPDAPWGTVFPAAAFTGQEMLVVDLETGRTQSYDPEAEVWTQLETAPKPFDGVSPSVWTGSELLIFDRYKPGRNYAYDPETRTWRRLARSPLKQQWLAGWADGQVVVRGRNRKDLAAYDITDDTWRMLPDSVRVDGLHGTGDEMLVVTCGGERARTKVRVLDLGADAWGEASRAPEGSGVCRADQVRGRLVFASAMGWEDAITDATYDPATGSWAAQDYDCPITTGGALSTGELLVGEYGGVEFDGDPDTPTIATFGHVALDPETGACYAVPGRDVWEDFTEHGDRSWTTDISTGDALLYWSGANEDTSPPKTDGLAFWIGATE